MLLSVYMAPQRRVKGDTDEHDVMVFASTQEETLLTDNLQLLQSMFSNEQVKYIKLDESVTSH